MQAERATPHPGLPLGAAPIAYVLFSRFLKLNAADPAWPDRDRFVLSAGHGSALLYALLHLSDAFHRETPDYVGVMGGLRYAYR